MWQDEFAYALTRKGKASFLLAVYGKNVYCPAPPQPFNVETLATVLEYMKKVNGAGPGISRIEGLTESQKQTAEKNGFPTRPALSEYLYDRSQLAGLHGDPYRAKRADLNHLLKNNAVLFRPYRAGDLKACGDLFELWKSQRLPSLQGQMGEKMLASSQKAHLRALLQGADWGMDAWVVLLGDRLVAYSSGAPLSADTYGIFLEVADLTVKGLSAYIFASVCRQVEPYARVNTGDAEGLPLLAESKNHWHPIGQDRALRGRSYFLKGKFMKKKKIDGKKQAAHSRVDWNQYFMNIAREVATRATCDRKHVGAVIVRDKTILSTGYNGSIRGMPHCDDAGHMMEDGHCVATIHAESNAVIQAARNGVRLDGGEIYVTASPCWNCFKMLANSGVKTIYYEEFYRDDRIFKIAKKLGIKLEQIPD